jgi:hypothetical protein
MYLLGLFVGEKVGVKELLLELTASGPVGTPTSIFPCGLVRHQALAIAIRSPQGFRESPYRPNPLAYRYVDNISTV